MKRTPLKRTATLARSSSALRRRGRVKATNAKRRLKEWARAYGSEERVAFVKALGCLVAGRGVDACFGPVDVAHVATGGMGRKADASLTVGLCRGHHCEQHQYGTARFGEKYGVDLVVCAAQVEWRWQRHLASSRAPEPIGSILPRVLADLTQQQDEGAA